MEGSPLILRTRQDRTRNSSEDETANVNFLYDDIVHVLQSTAPSPNCTTRRILQCEHININRKPSVKCNGKVKSR